MLKDEQYCSYIVRGGARPQKTWSEFSSAQYIYIYNEENPVNSICIKSVEKWAIPTAPWTFLLYITKHKLPV